MKITLTASEWQIVLGACLQLRSNTSNVWVSLSTVSGGLSAPKVYEDFMKDLDYVRMTVKTLTGSDATPIRFEMAEKHLQMVRTALSHFRRNKASSVEAGQRELISGELAIQLQKTLEPLDSILNHETLKQMEPWPVPRLADFLSPQALKNKDPSPSLAQEELESRHKVLLSPSLIKVDLEAYRRNCEDRRVSFAVAFADLDDFKRFNTEIGEVRVDLEIIPPILAAVERAAYGHGRAYRYGGDEFVLLMPNTDTDVAAIVVRSLKRAVEGLDFRGVSHKPRLSAGIWVTFANSHLTATELVHNASMAKAAAKELGKSRIVIRRERASNYDEEIIE